MLMLKDVVRVDREGGDHHAFTDMVNWKGHWYLTFRAATAHDARDGQIVVMRSPDLRHWSDLSVAATEGDDRDPKLLATPDRLLLYYYGGAQGQRMPLIQHSDDGEAFVEPRPCYDEHAYLFWRPVSGPDNAYYVAAHTQPRPGQLRTVTLLRSNDGMAWEPVSPIWSSPMVNETAITFTRDGELVALLRGAVGTRRGPSAKGVLAFAQPPYTTWEYVDTTLAAQGPALAHLDDGIYAAARKFRWNALGERLPSVTALYVLDDRMLHEFLVVPSGGDCSYAAIVKVDHDHVAMSYYSSHEGASRIYIAHFQPLPMPAGHCYLSRHVDARSVDVQGNY